MVLESVYVIMPHKCEILLVFAVGRANCDFKWKGLNT